MGFSQELKDFTSGFKTGYTLSTERTKAEKKTAFDVREEERAAERGVFQQGAGAIPDAPPSTPQTSETGKVPTFVQLEKNITDQESGGNYQAVGPTHPKLGRALGYAQVMEANLPEWSKAALGREVTPDEFLANPDVQKKIVRHRLGGYYNQYGPEGAASMWFTGRPRPTGRKDSLGTRDHDYVRRAVKTAALPVDEELEEPTIYAATGGMIEAPVRPQSDASLVRNTDTGVDDDYDPSAHVDIDSIADMARTGFAHLEKTFGLNKTGGIAEADPRSQDGVKALAHNVGAARPEEVEQIKNTVDPQRKLPTEELRAIAGWNAVYKYHTQRGNPEAAARAASAMLMYSKQAAQIAGTMGLAAAEEGDKLGLAKSIASGYEALPDGKSLKIDGETPKGVKFKLVDETGEITEQGEATMDQMVKIATGMQNGTEWFRAANLLKSRNVTAQRDKKRSDARAAFEGATTDDRDYLNTLDDETRAKYLAMDPRDRKEFAARHESREKEQAKEERFTERMATADEKENYRRTFQMFNTARQQGNWETQREQVMSANDKRLALIERDLSDRNARHGESQEARRKRYEQIDQRILDRGARGTVRLTAGERKEQAARQAVDVNADAAAATEGIDAEGNPVASEMQYAGERPGAVRSDYGYQNAVKENKSPVIDLDETSAKVDDVWKSDPKRATTELRPEHREVLTGLAAGIARGNNLSTDGAIRAAIDAVNPNNPLRFVQDPRDPQARMVRIGNSQPLRMGADQLNAIAMARGGRLNRDRGRALEVTPAGNTTRTGNGDGAGPAHAGVSGNPHQPTERGISRGLRAPLNQVQEKEAAIERERKMRNYREKRQAIDLEYSGDIGLIRR